MKLQIQAAFAIESKNKFIGTPKKNWKFSRIYLWFPGDGFTKIWICNMYVYVVLASIPNATAFLEQLP